MTDETEDRGATGWFSVSSLGPQHDLPDDPVRDVDIRVDEYGGPFWSSDGALGDDFEELRAWIGISRALYADVMAWHDAAQAAPVATATQRARQKLLRRLAAELPPEIEVTDSPRNRQPPPASPRTGVVE
ncbi:hypothetical protein [Nocardioides dongkuii]|uniref:hypothetical protein n=1 Tax=Nocardioides dongkuii TaxID=2760089 RepID=UPI0015FE0413|nr:hypothetical protein [Nocardioides dongkuii]